MRSTASQHLESLRTCFWKRGPHNDMLRPSLNVPCLIRSLKEVQVNNASDSLSHHEGKKRVVSRSSSPSERDVKRRKTSINESVGNNDDLATMPQPMDVVPVYHHLAEIQYSLAPLTQEERDHMPDDYPEGQKWVKEDEMVLELLEGMFSGITEPKRIDLGNIIFKDFHGRLVAEGRSWLLSVPRFNQEIDLGAHDFISSNIEDIFTVCHMLMVSGRAKIDAHLFLIGLPFGTYDKTKSELPFRLQFDMTVSLVPHAISMPIPYHTKTPQLEDAQRRFLNFVFPTNSSTPTSFEGEINITFFYSILRPAPRLQSGVAQDAMQPELLLPTLLPFQKRSVGWMLEREGKVVNPGGEIVPITSSSSLPLFWDKVGDRDHAWYINRLSGAFSVDAPHVDHAFGGILADEQGLGKTLECIALILLNPAPGRNPTIKHWDAGARLEVKQIKTTLIVTPNSLLSQWADELKAHAPALKVYVYDGWSKLQSERKTTLKTTSKTSVASDSKPKRSGKGKRKVVPDGEMQADAEIPPSDTFKNDEFVWEEFINTFDVCLTTYNVLRQDLTVARAVPIRPRREDVVYSNVPRPRSPLVVCEWYRVIMDEVQMVGGGKVEDMVSLIPRLSSFAVSGTPARLQVYDLIHVLNFLRVNNIFGPLRLWKRLLKPGFADLFTSFFRQYAIRTMKAAVKDELTIPQQTRFLVSIELGRVERHVYDQNLEAALLELGLDARGVAASEGWQVDTALLRSLIHKLRGICTHPQVGQLQKDKLYKPGALKSMSDVLEAMKDQNWRNLMDDRKSKVQALIRYAQLQQHFEDPDRYQHALETLLQAEKESKEMVDVVKAAIADHDVNGVILKNEAAALRESRRQSLSAEPEEPSPDNGKGKEKERMSSPTEMDDPGDSDLPKNPAGEEHGVKRRSLQQRLRECYVCLHRVKFLQGDAYHMLGVSHSPSEDAAYAAAEEIRRDLLKNTEQNAKYAMAQLSRQAAAGGITRDALLIEVPYCGRGGIRSADLFDEANEIIENTLNEQSALLWEWRSRVETLLTENLTTGDEADGQEYARSLDTQGEAETYLQVYNALLADRREVLVAERTLLAAHDAREKKLRHTKAAIRAAVADAELDIMGDIELQPEHEVLHKDLSIARKELLQESHGRALRSVMVDLNAIAARIQNVKDPEKIIAREGAQQLRELISAQGTLMDKLEADLARFRKAFNERILYFRQLQEISDSVAEVTWESSLGVAIQAVQAEKNELDAKINTSRARDRYLHHLAKNKEEGTLDEDDETCILCRCEFIRGFITQCAHIFCEGCLKMWLLRKEGKACPVCRVIINVDQMQRFTVTENAQKDADLLPPAKPVNGEPAPRSRRVINYNMIDPALFKEIQTMESFGSYGRKIQALVQHLLYLQITDPGAKSIVFSAWADSLHIIKHALETNNIPCLRIDQNSKGQNAAKKFKTDPQILVLLLHGERENAGLNVTCASRVFLVESVVHHGFEVQAIARIDRMGQTRPTEVYCYYAEDTVERNILDLAVKQGLSLYTKENYTGSLNVSSLAIDTNKKAAESPVRKKVQKGDFILDTNDMLAILFPHLFEDIEYLLPPQDDAAPDHDRDPFVDVGRNGRPARASASREYMNSVAGPSRIS